MLQVKEILRAFNVIVVEMRESDSSKRISLRRFHVLSNFSREIKSLVVLIRRIPHGPEIEENLIIVRELYSATIGIAEWVES
jgi:hypothetical protein